MKKIIVIILYTTYTYEINKGSLLRGTLMAEWDDEWDDEEDTEDWGEEEESFDEDWDDEADEW